jgi:hypothetical protein
MIDACSGINGSAATIVRPIATEPPRATIADPTARTHSFQGKGYAHGAGTRFFGRFALRKTGDPPPRLALLAARPRAVAGPHRRPAEAASQQERTRLCRHSKHIFSPEQIKPAQSEEDAAEHALYLAQEVEMVRPDLDFQSYDSGAVSTSRYGTLVVTAAKWRSDELCGVALQLARCLRLSNAL